MKCRGCNKPCCCEELIDLGNQAIVNFNNSPDDKDDFSPLLLVKCRECGLVQLRDTVPPERLFSEFHYLSGINQSMNDALFDVVKDVEKHVQLKPGDIVCDIGANDGTLLSYYRGFVRRIGFDPAQNITNIYDFPIYQDYFSPKTYWGHFDNRHTFRGKKEKAKVVTAIAMFYDLENPNKFCNDVYEILSDDGIFVVQMNDLDSMVQNISVDNICHEHLCYYSIDTLLPLLMKNGLYPIDVSWNNINGGSIRVICSKVKNSYYVPPRERYKLPTLEDMWGKFEIEKKRLLKYVEKHRNEIWWAYGASTRGNTLLQLLGLDWRKINAIADRNPKKWGKWTAGGNIPICSEEDMREAQPDNLLVLPYYFEKEFLAREISYLKAGGKMIFPLPKFRIFTADKDGSLRVHGL